MRLRARLRIGNVISLGSILAIGSVLAWSTRESRRAQSAEDRVVDLRQLVLERGMMRDEFLLYHEPRARAQWEAVTTRLESRLREAGNAFEDAESQRLVGEMLSVARDSGLLFAELVRMSAAKADVAPPPRSGALRERLTSKLILMSYELDGRASSLAAIAGRHSESTQRRTTILIFLLVGSTLAIFTVNFVLVSKLVERRIERLEAGAERVAAGDLKHRIAVRGDDELAALGRSFDEMAEKLEQRAAQLEAANQELEAFSYSVSHDLRAPLRAVDGFSSILLEDHSAQLDAEGKRLLGVVRSNTRQMGHLIDDLLSFSRIGRQEMTQIPVDMKALAELAFRGLGAADGVSFSVGALPRAEADPALMRQAWANLISNAVKFTGPKPGRAVEVEGRTEDGRVVYSVKDNGVGFDMAYANKLFNVFQRLHSSEEFEGTGVGLALVRRIVQRHGGEVWAEGKVGEGATFSFSLPLAGGST